MFRDQLLNDDETAIRTALQGWQAKMWTAMPATVISVNWDEMTIEAQPTIQGVVTNPSEDDSFVNLPPLVDVPLVFPSGGGFALTFPIVAGDEVLIVIANRCIDAWWQQGGIQVPMENRMHDLSDAFAIPGPKSLPNVIGSISSTDVQLRNIAGTVLLGLSGSGLIQMESATQSLKTVLLALNTALTTFATGLTTVNLASNAATLVTALGVVATDIEALLE